MTSMHGLKMGDLVRFCSEYNGGAVHRIVSVTSDGMIEIHDIEGYFAPSLFVVAHDIGDIPPPVERGVVSIEGDDIVIRITPDALKFASENGVLSTFLTAINDFRKVHVYDMGAWRSAVVDALCREGDDGDTPIFRMLDRCLEDAVEQGADGIRIEGTL